MIRRFVATFGVALLAASVSAQAQWAHAAEADPFSKTTMHIVAGQHTQGMIGFRCEGPDTLTAMFVTTEKISTDTIEKIRVLPVNLLLLVDSGEVIRAAAELGTAPGVGTLRVTSDAPEVLIALRAASAARKQVGMAVEVYDKIMYRATIPAGNVRGHLGKLINGCKLELSKTN